MAKRRKQVERSWESPSVSLTNPGISEILGNNPSSSGVEINRHTVFALPAFLRGVDLIASTVGRVDCNTYKASKFGGKVADNEHAAHYLLTRRPNDWQTPFEFKRELASNAIWAGNGYAYVVRDDVTAKPTDLILLDPDNTWPVIVRSNTDLGDVKVYYQHEIQGQTIIIPFDEMIHVKSLGHCDGFMGMRLIDIVKETLGLGIAVIKYGSVYFRHSGSPSMIVEFPAFMKNKEQIEQFRLGFNGMHAGLSNAHKLAILQGGAKLAKSTIDNEAAQFLGSREMSEVDVANILGLPPHKVGAKIATSYGSLEQENLSLLNDCFDKWFTNIEQQLEQKLLTEVEKVRDSRWIEFKRDQLLQADHQTKVNTIVALVNNGLMLPNYACAELNLPAVDEEEDKLRLPTNVTIQGEEAEPPPAPPAPPQAPIAPQAPQGQEAPKSPPESDGKATDAKRLAKLTGSVLKRFLGRLEKAQGKDLAKHRGILVETLAPVTDDAEAVADELLDTVREELEAVLPEQVGTVLSKVDVSYWTERVLA